jgi:hypothetical protein
MINTFILLFCKNIHRYTLTHYNSILIFQAVHTFYLILILRNTSSNKSTYKNEIMKNDLLSDIAFYTLILFFFFCQENNWLSVGKERGFLGKINKTFLHTYINIIILGCK